MRTVANASLFNSTRITVVLSLFVLGLMFCLYQSLLGPVAPVIPDYSWKVHTKVVIIGNRCGGWSSSAFAQVALLSKQNIDILVITDAMDEDIQAIPKYFAKDHIRVLMAPNGVISSAFLPHKGQRVSLVMSGRIVSVIPGTLPADRILQDLARN